MTQRVTQRVTQLPYEASHLPCRRQVDFHRPELFAGKLTLAPPGVEIDCSCSAARLVAPNLLRVLHSPLPSLSECPAGSVLVRRPLFLLPQNMSVAVLTWLLSFCCRKTCPSLC